MARDVIVSVKSLHTETMTSLVARIPNGFNLNQRECLLKNYRDINDEFDLKINSVCFSLNLQ